MSIKKIVEYFAKIEEQYQEILILTEANAKALVKHDIDQSLDLLARREERLNQIIQIKRELDTAENQLLKEIGCSEFKISILKNFLSIDEIAIIQNHLDELQKTLEKINDIDEKNLELGKLYMIDIKAQIKQLPTKKDIKRAYGQNVNFQEPRFIDENK